MSLPVSELLRQESKHGRIIIVHRSLAMLACIFLPREGCARLHLPSGLFRRLPLPTRTKPCHAGLLLMRTRYAEEITSIEHKGDANHMQASLALSLLTTNTAFADACALMQSVIKW
jgi:hypothetical protein